MLRREQIIGVVSSWDIRWKESEGCSLLITDSRMVGAGFPVFDDNFWGYFPPGKERNPGLAREAERRAEEILLRRSFELQRDKIVKIIYDKPGMMLGGRLLFATV